MKRAMSWQRGRSRVVKPAQPHWFFSSSKGFSLSALHGVLAGKEIEDGNEYLSSAGYEVLKGAMYMQRAYGDAQNFGLTALETRWESLNTDAARVVASVIRKVRTIVEHEAPREDADAAAA